MPSTPFRQTILGSARRIVVKLGTQLLTADDGLLDVAYLKTVASQVARLRQKKYEVTMVVSGAIGAGRAELGIRHRPADVAAQQAIAAVGQRRLMTHLHEAFAPFELNVAQLLLTRSDFDDRVRFLNIRNCLAHLQRLGCIPIINENDTVAVDELRFGDNDMLSALITNAIRADALFVLTVVNGLLDEKGTVVDLVQDVTAVSHLVRTTRSKLGTGGIRSKLDAVRLVTEAGEVAVIANGREKDVLLRLLNHEQIGTLFVPPTGRAKLDSRQRWISLTKRPAGTVSIDDGAATALRAKGKSLLATGITDTTGQFERGEVLLIRDRQGREVARGLTNYSADELRLIMGKKSSQFAKLLGRSSYAEVIHRDNLVLANGAADTQ